MSCFSSVSNGITQNMLAVREKKLTLLVTVHWTIISELVLNPRHIRFVAKTSFLANTTHRMVIDGE